MTGNHTGASARAHTPPHAAQAIESAEQQLFILQHEPAQVGASLIVTHFRAYTLDVLENNQRTGLAARNTQARSRLKSVHAAFFSSARISMARLWAGRAGGRKPCRSLCSGLLTRTCPPAPFSSEVADSYHNTGVSHDW